MESSLHDGGKGTYTTVSKGVTTTEEFETEVFNQHYANELFENDDNEVEELLNGDENQDMVVELMMQEPKTKVSSIVKKLDAKSASFRYDIRMPKAKHSDDKEKIESKYREDMRQSEKAFTIIKEYCKESLSVGYNMLDKHIEDLLNTTTDVSPLLKYFNDLARDTNFRIPCKSLLEFD